MPRRPSSPRPRPTASRALPTISCAAGATHLLMEVSSHALDQDRLLGIQVEVAGFTNLTQDHLDYHGTMQQYGDAKARLFTRVRAGQQRDLRRSRRSVDS